MEPGRCLLARLDHGADIIGQITDLAKDKKVDTGLFNVIGALTGAELACYDQSSHEYQKIPIEEPVELASCMGNISIRDGQPAVHAHAVLADCEGNTIGGHLISGRIFAAELCLRELSGMPLMRMHDTITGLYLWGES